MFLCTFSVGHCVYPLIYGFWLPLLQVKVQGLYYCSVFHSHNKVINNEQNSSLKIAQRLIACSWAVLFSSSSSFHKRYIWASLSIWCYLVYIIYSNMTSLFPFVEKTRIISSYYLISRWTWLMFPLAAWIVTRIMLIEGAVLFELHKLCATFSASVCIIYRLPIKVYYRICTLRHIRIEINHGSQNVFWVLTWIGGY